MLNMTPNKTIIFVALFVLALGLISFGARRVFGGQTTSSSDSRVSIEPAKGQMVIDKEFTFPVQDAKGKEVADFKYTLQRAETRNEIVIKGQKAVAVSGRTFLVVYLKITNSQSQTLQINTRDYIRLSVNDNKTELLAPDVHNDSVQVQPLSTKYTTLGFAINDTDENLMLSVGEIGGNKEEIALQKL
jgi:hypothetical protein